MAPKVEIREDLIEILAVDPPEEIRTPPLFSSEILVSRPNNTTLRNSSQKLDPLKL